MTAQPHRPSPLPTPTRWLAAWLAGVLLVLSVLAYAPHAHEALHCDAHDEEHQCSITWLQQGVDLPLAMPTAPQRADYWFDQRAATAVVPDLAPPRYLHLPGRAPPGLAG